MQPTSDGELNLTRDDEACFEAMAVAGKSADFIASFLGQPRHAIACKLGKRDWILRGCPAKEPTHRLACSANRAGVEMVDKRFHPVREGLRPCSHCGARVDWSRVATHTCPVCAQPQPEIEGAPVP